MQKTLVLVVHGIGEQSPGETIDALTGGAVRELALTGPIEGRTEMIAEPVEGSEHLTLFPCTIRRTVIRPDDTNGLTQDQEVMAGEVYWSDLSPAPKGAFSTGFDLLRTILGLGYLALENVDDGASPVSAATRRGVYLFVWIFFTLIAPANALLFLASLTLLTDQFGLRVGDGPGQIPGALLLAAMGAVIALACWLWRRRLMTPRTSYMMRAFMAGLGGQAAVVCIAALLVWALPDSALIEALRRASCRSYELSACWSRDYQDIAMFAWAATLLMGMVWLIAVMILLGLFLSSTLADLGWRRTILLFGLPVLLFLAAQVAGPGRWAGLLILMAALGGLLLIPAARARAMRLWARLTAFFGQRDQIYLSLCNAMLILWMVITSAFWALFSGTMQKLDSAENGRTLLTQIYHDYSGLLLSTMSYILFAAAALVLIGTIPVVLRQIWRGDLAQDQQSGVDVWCGRLILNPVINILLFLLILWIAFGGVSQAAITTIQVFNLDYYYQNPDTLIGAVGAFHDRITQWNVLSVAVTAFLGVAIYRGSAFIAAALGVARDISIYSTRTLAEKPGPDSDSRYAQRERILGRFRLVHDHLARQMDYDRLIVVAHSQGTVVAAQSLAADGLPDRPRFLLTMGSPLTHIYGQYFPRGFALDPLTPRLTRWINIYRCDDFVGTQVRAEGGGVENLRVAPAGHTGYWTDRNVWRALRGALGQDQAAKDGDSPDGPLVA